MTRHKRNAINALIVLYSWHDKRGESAQATRVAQALIATRLAFIPLRHIAT